MLVGGRRSLPKLAPVLERQKHEAWSGPTFPCEETPESAFTTTQCFADVAISDLIFLFLVYVDEALEHVIAVVEPDLLHVRRVAQVLEDRFLREVLVRDPLAEGIVVI